MVFLQGLLILIEYLFLLPLLASADRASAHLLLLVMPGMLKCLLQLVPYNKKPFRYYKGILLEWVACNCTCMHWS